jgi:glycogen operon protein
MLATLMLSNGVPMLLMGDECRRTQHGNNNAYCQDNSMSWFDWHLLERHHDILRFVRALIAFRKDQANVRRTTFLTGTPPTPGALPDVSWYLPAGKPMDWKSDLNSLTCMLSAVRGENHTKRRPRHLLMYFHAQPSPSEFILPPAVAHLPWRMFINTMEPSPHDVYPDLDGPDPPRDGRMILQGRSFVAYTAEADWTPGPLRAS